MHIRIWLILGFLSLALPAEAQTLIVLNKSEANASLIDLPTGKVVATVPTGDGPHEIAVSPDGRVGAVADYGTQRGGNTITLIHIPQAKVLRKIQLGKFRRPHGLEWISPDRLAITSEAQKSLVVVNLQEEDSLTRIKTDQDASHMLVLSPDRKRAYVSNIASGTLTVLDLLKEEKLVDIPTGAGAEGLDVTPDGKEVWVGNRGANTVSIIDTESLKVIHTLETGKFPIRVKITPDGKKALISNAADGNLSVFSVQEKKELTRIPIKIAKVEGEDRLFAGQFGDSSVPIGILIQPDGKRAFIAHTRSDLVSMVDLETNQVIGFLQAGKQPDGLGFSQHTVEVQTQEASRENN